MSKDTQKDHSGYTEHELLFIRRFVLFFYALVLFSVIIIEAIIAIITKNPFCGVYGLLPAALLVPLHKIIDRVFPPLTADRQNKPLIPSIKKIRSKTKTPDDPLPPPGA